MFKLRDIFSSPSSWTIVLALSFLIGLTYTAFSPGLDGPFLLDDQPNFEVTAVDSLAWSELRIRIFGNFRPDGLSRSVGKLSFALTQYFSGYDPRAFKYQNLALHLANGLLVFWVAALLIQTRSGGRSTGYWEAFFVSAIWLLHPLQVSTVLYAVQRLVILSAFFALLALVLYIKGRLLGSTKPLAGAGLILVGLCLFWPLSVLSKENGVLLGPILLLIEWFIFRFRTEPGRERILVRSILGTFVVAPITVALVYLAVRHDTLLAGYAGRSFNLTERLMTEVHAVWLYLKLILVPIPSHMTLYHDGFSVQRAMDLSTWAGAIGLAALCILALALRRAAPLVGLGILWFFVWHLMESTLIPLELVFEHRNYLALMGIVLALAVGVSTIAPLAARPRMLVGTASALTLLLGLNTASRAFSWSSYDLLMISEYAINTRSPRLTENMYFVSMKRGDLQTAREYLRKLRTLDPDNASSLLLEASTYCRDSKLPDTLATDIVLLIEKGRISPGTINAMRALAESVEVGACKAATRGQILEMTRSMAQNPRVHQPETRVAALVTYASLAATNGDWTHAEHALEQALAIASAQSTVTLDQTVQVIGKIASTKTDFDSAYAFLQQVTHGYEKRLAQEGIQLRLSASAKSGG